ncbi:Chromatin assembly factor 1 subunit B [Nymphon striatum]|nr:Chromatin assembly factor 1 subunit B [Nymphon striatum]
MKCTVPEISWHNRDPVLSVDFQLKGDSIERLATAGTDSHVLVWYVSHGESGAVKIDFASDLTRHQKAVNIVRFSPNGEILASADDEAAIITWKLGERNDFFGDDGDENKENWVVLKMLRGHVEDIYDLSWSHCSSFIISGSVDNTAIMWDVKKGKNLGLLSDHKGFVQGVSWDPKNNYVATLSSDRFCRIYNVNSKKVVQRIHKASISVKNGEQTQNKLLKLFHDDTLKTFCRRLTFTPDGELLIAPAGVLDVEEGKPVNTTYIFSRTNFSKPAVYLPSKNKYTIAVRCCPVYFALRPIPNPGNENCSSDAKPWQKYSTIFSFPYRIVFAVATQDSIIIYDTQQPIPIAHVSNCHYTRLSDIAWSRDGRILIVSSTDGYCSFVTFEENELGVPYDENAAPENQENSKNSNAELKDEPVKSSPLCEKNVRADPVSPAKPTPVTPKSNIIASPVTPKSNIPASPVTPKSNILASSDNKINMKSEQQSDKKTPKRVNFITLSSPKEKKICKKSPLVKKKTALEASFPEKSDVPQTSDQQIPHSSFSGIFPSKEVVVPMDCSNTEDPTDIKLVLEPTTDGCSMDLDRSPSKQNKSQENTKSFKEHINFSSLGKPVQKSSSAPRRVQLITLSKKSASK